LRASDLRILIVMIAGAAIFGVVDGSMWRGLLTPTIAYRPAILFALILVFGWRGFVCSQIVFLAAFALFLGWQGAVLITPLYLVSYACAFWMARTFAGRSPCLSGQRSTLAFLAAAAIAPLLPALLSGSALRVIGITPSFEVPEFVDYWLRGVAGILVLTPALMCYSRKLAEWGAVSTKGAPPHSISGRNVLELGVETAVWGVALWMAVEFKVRYGLNITYLTFLPPLGLTLLRGMRMANLAIAANGILATTLWSQLHWAGALPINDLRLLITIYSATILVLASVVDERERAGRQVQELRLEEAALRKSEEHFRTLANSAPVMLWLSGTDKLCTFVNEPWLKFSGRTLTEELGDGWAAGVHPDDLDRRVTTYASSFDARRSFEMEYRLRRADCEYRWILDKGTPLYRDGEFAGYIGSCIDVTERTRVDEALRESEERFRRVFEEGPLGLALVGKDYRFVKVNAALCQMVKYSEASLLQMTFADITHPDDLQADMECAERLFSGEIPFFTLRKRYIKKNGEIIWINLTASIVHDKDGAPIHGLAMVEDITEAKRTQEEALSRQKLESIGVLAGGIAHDFNNLLGGILSQTESIEQDLPESSPQIEELHRIKEAALRGSEIVRELMIYSGQDKADLQPVNVARLAAAMLELLKVSVSKHAILKTDLPEDLPAVRGSAPQLRQLVMNLVTNASEALGETDGTICVALSRVASGQDLASNEAANWRQSDCLRLEVSDTGSGMTEETQARIFDPFFTTKFAGRGLGLAVVRSVVSSHGGAINVVSAPGRGTTFQIDLPCAGGPSNPVGNAGIATSDERISGTARTVLLVEDEDMLRHAVAKMLRIHGYAVIEAGDGFAALDLVRSYRDKIEVILLDLTIPGAPSSEVVAEAQRIRPEVTVFLMSAYSRGMAPQSLNVPEVKGFIRKPFQMSDLVQLLRSTTSAELN
jgi:PAS domain S-box-containing protein